MTLDYRFDKQKSRRLKKILKLNQEALSFSLGRRASRLWYSLIVMAAEQGFGTNGTFRVSDLVRLWECKKSGRLYSDIKQTFLSLASFNPHYDNNKSGANRVEWGYSFFDAWLIEGEGDDAIFSFELNKVALGITTEWLDDKKLSFKTLKGGYLSIPVSELKGKRLDPKYENFIERLRLLPPGKIKVLYYTILDDWIKIGDDMIREHRMRCHDLVIDYLQKAKTSKEITGFSSLVRGFKNWRETWAVEIMK
ncbi:MAG: hypothetical protein LBI74_07915 [Synergistaceae bacterium]|nr:hypothetical protein [Synergistaceae bacterium]